MILWKKESRAHSDLRDTFGWKGRAQMRMEFENLSASSIVYTILHDFCGDDNVDDQDETAQDPTFILIRRAQRKTYGRTSTEQLKKLLFLDASEKDANQHCHKESQSYELDNSVELAQHTIIDFEKYFDSFEFCDDHNDRTRISYSNASDIEIEVAATTSTTATSVVPVVLATTSEATNDKLDPSLFSENDDFECIVTHIEMPKGSLPCPKEQQRNVDKILTSISSNKIGIEDSSMHSTPSTSKTSTVLNDHRVAKRLQFAAETNVMEIQNGFSLASAHNAPDGMLGGFATARGGAIQLSDKAIKRAAGTFIDIDTKYKHIDAVADNVEPQLKRIKTSGESVTFKEIEPERPKDIEFNGFQMTNGKNAKLTKARNIFDDFNLSDLNVPVNERQPIAIAGPPLNIWEGFMVKLYSLPSTRWIV